MATIRMAIDWSFDEENAMRLSEDPMDDIVETLILSLNEYLENEGLGAAANAIATTADAIAGLGTASEYTVSIEHF